MPKKPNSIIVHLKVHTEDCPDPPETFATAPVTAPEPIVTSSIPYEKVEKKPAPVKRAQEASLNGIYICNSENADTRVYPRSNDTVCWWDGHPFDTVPIFIPKRIHADGTYAVYGNFCSPECAMAYLWNEGDIDNETRWERTALLREMTARIFNENCTYIKEALPRFSLKEYGGDFTIDEFRRINTQPNISLSVNYPPVIADTPIIQIKNMFTKPKVSVQPNKVLIHDDRIRKAEANLSETSTPAASLLQQTLANRPVAQSTGGGGIMSMMKVRVVNA